jgi:WhiB family redox-sensing transcriptional regulator
VNDDAYRLINGRSHYNEPRTALFTNSEQWQADAQCKTVDDPDVFYPTKGHGGGELRAARAICWACPVRLECLEYALQTPSHDQFGIWGGLTVTERNRIIRRRRRKARVAA